MGARLRIPGRLLAVLALLIAAQALFAQVESEPVQDEAAIETTVSAEAAPDFFYRLDENAAPVFSQMLRWLEDPNALEYRLVVTDGSGIDIIDEIVQEPQKEVRLQPGSYTYRIITYNLLGKAEAETERIPLLVIKAEQPVIDATSPKTIFMDSLDGRVTISGERLVEGCAVTLVAANGKRYGGRVKDSEDGRTVVVVFPDDAYEPGEYSLKVENPGGLSSTIEGALRIRFQRPVDLLASVGYSPFVALSDQWVVDSWLSRFHPLGFEARLQLYFMKRRWGSLGLGFGAEYRRMSASYEGATLSSDFCLAGADFQYKYRITRQLHCVARVGGGLSLSRHIFDYEGFLGPRTSSRDPFVRGGLALQAFLPSKLYGEIGADASYVFLLQHKAFGITPKLSLGYQIY